MAPSSRTAAPLLALAALLAAVTILRLPDAWASGNALNHVSGAWAALADDLARGVLYRPLAGEGPTTGGTRYFPLAFALHAGLVRAGAPLLAAGHALAIAAALLLAGAIVALLRGGGVPRRFAAAGAALALGGFAAQHALGATRGDLLAAALAAAGLAAVGRAAGGGGRAALGAAVAFLALAVLTKPTALAATAAGALVLRAAGRPGRALALAAGVGLLAGGGLLATDLLSAGRFVAILEACATGGAGLADLLRAPFRLGHRLALEDPAGAALVGAALLAAAAAPRAGVAGRGTGAAGLALPLAWMGAAAAAALAAFASPGTGVNHLVDLEAASAATLAAALARLQAAPAPRRPRLAAAARAAAVGAALAAVVGAAALWREDRRGGRLDDLAGALAALPAGPVLSEDPLVPLVAGRRVAVLDPWMLRLASGRDPAVAAAVEEALRHARFAAVVLLRDLDEAGADAWYERIHLGPRVAGAVAERYRLAGRFGRYVVYLPAAAVPAGPGERAVPPRPATTAAVGR